MMEPNDRARDLTSYACTKLEENLRQIVRCAELLTPREVWHRPSPRSNSVGNLILHLTGNIRQWIVSGVDGEPFERDRPAEFAARGPQPTEEIVGPLCATVRRAMEIISALDERALGTRRSIQGYDVSMQVVIFHVVEHLSFHTGQIIYATKALRDVDLSLYDSAGRKVDDQDASP